MRAIFGIWAVWASAVLAAPGTSPSSPAPAESDARRFALDMCAVLDQIADGYVRDLPREKFYEAALAGMHQAARRPLPGALAADVRKALTQPPPGPNLSRPNPPAPAMPREDLFVKAFQHLGLARHDAILAGCRAAGRLLDPHSGLVTAEEQRRSIGLDHESLGLGLEMHGTAIEAVHSGGPAQLGAGLRPGDVLVSVNGTPAGSLPAELEAALKSHRVHNGPARMGADIPAPEPEPIRRVTIACRRPGEQAERSATLYRERYRPETVLGVARRENNTWTHIADGRRRIAHVRIAALSRGTGDELRAVVEGLLAQGVRGLVLDLRWCPGGYLNEAVDVAGLFLGDELIATVKGRGRKDSIYRGTGARLAGGLPVVVLVNAETMGGAELVAAALQDHKRGKVCGQRTHGKASVQTPLPTGMEGVGFKLTTGTFVRPSGKNLHRFAESRPGDDWGVIPDEDFRVSPGLSAKLKSDWMLWSLRPAASLERLALDDPTMDAQRHAAMRLVQRMIDEGKRLSRRK